MHTYGVYVFPAIWSDADVINLLFDVGHRLTLVYTPDTPKADDRQQPPGDHGVSDPGINHPVSRSQLAREDHRSHPQDPASKMVDDRSTWPCHGAGISGNGVETRAVSAGPFHATRCKS